MAIMNRATRALKAGDHMEKDSHTPGGRDNERPAKTVQIASGAAEPKKPSNGAASPVGSSSGDAANRLKQRPSNDGARRPGDLIELSRASRSEIDGLLAETRGIQERSSKLTQSLMEELQTKVWRMIETALNGFQKEIHERVAVEASMILENLDVEAGARLAARVDQTLAKATEHQRLIERDIAAIAAENQKAASSVSARMAEEMQRRAAILKAEFESEAQAKVDEVKKNALEAAESARETNQTLADEMKKRTGEALIGFESRMAQIELEAIARTEGRIDAIAKSTTSMIAKQVQDAADRHVSKFFIQAFRNRLDQLADAFTEPRAAASEPEIPKTRARVGEFDRAAFTTPERVVGDAGHVILSPEPDTAGDGGAETMPASPASAASEPTDWGYASRESSFKKDFESRYGSERSYDEYAPAYRFGYGLAGDPRYQGKDWLSIEPEIKRAWEIRGEGNWEKFKGSIQYAWLSALAAGRN